MRNYDEFIEGLRQEVEVPEKVWGRVQETLNGLSDVPVVKSKNARKWFTMAASVVVVLAIGTGLCFANPALAARLPIIGRIFQQIEKGLTFSGDYEENRQIITMENEGVEDAEYVARDQGVKITASEIYCDGYSIFLTAQIDIEDGGLTSIPGHYTSGGSSQEETVSQGVYTHGIWKLKGENSEQELVNNNFEGKVLDDNTYIGMIKLDFDAVEQRDGILELGLTELGYDDVNDMHSEDISASNKIVGEWNLSIPFNVDTKDVKEISVDKKTDNGYGINKVFVSLYQVIISVDIPKTSVDDFSREEFEDLLAEHTKYMDNSEGPSVTYEEYLEQMLVYNELAVFNQDGIALIPAGSSAEKYIFAIKELEIKKLHIFLSDDEENAFFLMKAQNMEEAREKSIFEVTVDVGE